MASFNATAGLQFVRNNHSFILQDRIEGGWLIKSLGSTLVDKYTEEEFYRDYQAGKLIIKNMNATPAERKIDEQNTSLMMDKLPKERQEELRNRRMFLESYLRRYGDCRSIASINDGLNKLWFESFGKKPSASTVARWLKRYIDSGKNIFSLMPAAHLRGNRTRKIDITIEDMCQQAIREIYMTRERGSVDDTLDKAIFLVDKENDLRPGEHKLRLPTRTFISRLIKRESEIDRYTARYGKEAARHRFKTSIGEVICDRPLSRIEVDHTKMDVIIVDDETRLPIGRPWLTLVIDVFTRCILGFHLSFDPPSQATVVRAMKHAVMPKANLKDEFPDTNGEWPMHGIPELVMVDNGLEFHSEAFEAMCFELGVTVSYAPRKSPQFKGTVERALGTLNRSITGQMPGKTFSSIKERGDYDSAKHAVVTLKVLKACITKWIVDIYHKSIHSGISMSPEECWHMKTDPDQIRLPAHPEKMDCISGNIAKRKLWHYGIELNGLHYNNETLAAIYPQFGKTEVEVRWNPDNLGHVHVIVPGGGLMKVSAIPKELAYAEGLTLQQHCLIQKSLARKGDDYSNVVALAKEKEVIQEMIQSESKASRKKSSVNKHRFMQGAEQTAQQAPAEVHFFDDVADYAIPSFEPLLTKRNTHLEELV